MVEVNDKKFSLHADDGELMSLPKSALSAMIMHHESILLDLENADKPGKIYWSSGDATIYTKILLGLPIPGSTEFEKKKVLCIAKPLSDVGLTAESFQELVLGEIVLHRGREDDCIRARVGPHLKLNSTTSIVFHEDETFTICDDAVSNRCRIKLRTLIALIVQRKEILADLNSPDPCSEHIYGDDESVVLKTVACKNSRGFCFWIEVPTGDGPDEWIRKELVIRKHTFDLMLHVVLGGPMWTDDMGEYGKIKETRMLYWDKTPYNLIRGIEFSADVQKFTIINETHGVTLTLPTAALEALLDRKVQVLSDLESEEIAASPKRDFINEYWTNQSFAIRTGVLCNLFREFDCIVVRFTKVKDNECVFVAHREAFLKMLESYQSQERILEL